MNNYHLLVNRIISPFQSDKKRKANRKKGVLYNKKKCFPSQKRYKNTYRNNVKLQKLLTINKTLSVLPKI